MRGARDTKQEGKRTTEEQRERIPLSRPFRGSFDHASRNVFLFFFFLFPFLNRSLMTFSRHIVVSITIAENDETKVLKRVTKKERKDREKNHILPFSNFLYSFRYKPSIIEAQDTLVKVTAGDRVVHFSKECTRKSACVRRAPDNITRGDP